MPETLATKRVSLSASTLKLYLECPRCFWLQLNKKIVRPRGPFPSLSSGMDRILKNYFDTYRQQGALHEGVPFGVKIHEIATDPQGAYEVFQAGRQVLAGPMPASSDACGFCGWAKRQQAL